MALVVNLDFEVRHGEVIEVAPGIRRVTAPNAGAYTFRGTNSYILGGERVAVIDPGPDDPAHLDALLRAIGEAPVTHILLTHRHRDHASLAPRLRDRTGAPVLAGTRAGTPHDAPVRTGAVEPDRLFSDGEIIEGPMRIEAVATPGHASDHYVFALPDGTLLSGDHVMGWATTSISPPDGSMTAYLDSLERLLARPERLYLPGHGGPIEDAHAYLRGLRSHRRMREKAILDGLARGDRTVADLVKRNYPNLNPALGGGAAASTLAHLEDLIARGLVEADAPRGAESVYRAAVAPGSGTG